MAIIDPVTIDVASITALRAYAPDVKFVMMRCGVYPDDCYVRCFDAFISLYDSRQSIVSAISGLFTDDSARTMSDDLTSREKEIIIGVVKGLSNKEIASEMNISANTVMTHRRNIASKLQIHSPAGLTIYALASKLVKLEDVTNRPL